jgi:catalase
VRTLAIRERIVAHLRNVDNDLARTVANGLRLRELPAAAPAARPTIADLAPSPALSIAGNGPDSFAGRKLGVLISDGVDGAALDRLRAAAESAGASVEIVAPHVGGVKSAGGAWIEADEKLDGAPSVLYDAVAVLTTDAGARQLSVAAVARDFVSDAFAHCKFIGYTPGAGPLIEGVIGRDRLDEGVVQLDADGSEAAFIDACGALRIWAREAAMQIPAR